MYTEAVKLFLRLVKIPSPSGHESEVRSVVLRYLKKFSLFPKVDRAGNIITRVPGVGRPIILSAHLDTVTPCEGVRPVITKGIIRSDGTTILGADDKAGVATILALVNHLKKNKIRHRALELVFTVGEEVGCVGAKQIDYSKLRGKEAVVLDRSAPVNAITIATPFLWQFDIVCHGKAAHARSPGDGLSAITLGAQVVAELSKTRFAGVTYNFGFANGGEAFNVIPSVYTLRGEMRSLEIAYLKRVNRHWSATLSSVAKKNKGKIILSIQPAINGFKLKRSAPFVRELARAINKAAFKPEYVSALGGSDANIFYEHGIVAIPLGQGRSGAHSLRESMPLAAFTETEQILLALVCV